MNAAQSPRSPQMAGSGQDSSAFVQLALPPAVVEAVAERAAELVVERLAAVEDCWMGVEDAARYLACKPRRIYDLHSQRRIPAHKDGSRLLFRRSELDAYLQVAR